MRIFGIASALAKLVMQRLLLASSGALFLGSVGAFFLFVPLLSIATVVLMLVGLFLMFGFGFQLGAREPRLPQAASSSLPQNRNDQTPIN